MKRFGERPGSDYDGRWWRAVRQLYEEAFPGLPAGIDRAGRLGARWTEVSTPFALFEADRCVCHVGVISHPMRLLGRDVRVAGIHAVCTAADRRRRGLCRDALTRALDWADRTHDVVKLHTDVPAVYTGHGFRTSPTWRFRATARPAATVEKRLLRPSQEPADASLLADRLACRVPVSDRCATADPGWLVTIVAALSGRLDQAFWWLPDHDAVIAFDEKRDFTLVVDVIAAVLPPPEAILAAAPDPQRPALWSFSPDRIDPAAEPVRAPARIGSFMVRGAWPAELVRFGVSPFWEH